MKTLPHTKSGIILHTGLISGTMNSCLGVAKASQVCNNTGIRVGQARATAMQEFMSKPHTHTHTQIQHPRMWIAFLHLLPQQ